MNHELPLEPSFPLRIVHNEMWFSFLQSASRPTAFVVFLAALCMVPGSQRAFAESKPQALSNSASVIVNPGVPVPQFNVDPTPAVCVIGDSITHGGAYHANVFLFYATRFPHRELHMFNCGISGDTAAGVIRRLDWDVLSHKPSAATVLLGMNDAGSKHYLRDDEKSKEARQPAIEKYAANLTNLVEELRKAKVRVTLLTPTIYEQNADTGTPNWLGYNDALRLCGEEVKKVAKQFDLPVIDVHSAMNAVNEAAQRDDPKFTLVGRDRVHPGSLGHMVIAYVMLMAQEMPSLVSKTVVAADSSKVTEQVNAKVTQLKISPTELSFDCLESALPFPLPAGAQGVLKLVPFQKNLNQELLKVTGLADGKYTLTIDDQTVGQFDAAELAFGINLADNTKTPQYQQALVVESLNAKRHKLESIRLRGIAATEVFLRNSGKMNDPQAVSEMVLRASGWKPEMDKAVPSDRVNNIFDAYRKYKPVEKELLNEVEQTRAEMYKAAQPKLHRFFLKKN